MHTTKFQLLVLKALYYLVVKDSGKTGVSLELLTAIEEINKDLKRGTKM